MSSINDITGDRIITKSVTDTYRNNFGAIDWSKKAEPAPVATSKPKCSHSWMATMGMPPGPSTCMNCGVLMKDVPAGELV